MALLVVLFCCHAEQPYLRCSPGVTGLPKPRMCGPGSLKCLAISPSLWAGLPTFPTLPLQVRHQLEQGHTVKYLVPDSVLRYIYQHGLYGTAAHRPALLRVGEQQVDADSEA